MRKKGVEEGRDNTPVCLCVVWYVVCTVRVCMLNQTCTHTMCVTLPLLLSSSLRLFLSSSPPLLLSSSPPQVTADTVTAVLTLSGGDSNGGSDGDGSSNDGNDNRGMSNNLLIGCF